MANRSFPLPIKGFSEGLSVEVAPPLTSGYLNNVRAMDVLERKVRIGKRPGLKKLYSQQIGNATSHPCLILLSVTVVE